MEQNHGINTNGVSDDSSDRSDRDLRGSARERVLGAAAGYAEKAQHVAQDVAHKASDTANEALSSVGNKVSDIAGTIRENCSETGAMGAAGCAVADKLDSAGSYLATHDLKGIGNDVVSVVKKYPLSSLGVGVLAGAFLGRLMSRR